MTAPAVSYEVVGVTNAGTSGGGSVTISGLNFGSYSFTATAHAIIDGVCGTTTWTSATTTACLLGTPSTPSVYYSKVTVGAMVGTRAASLFMFDGPVVSGIGGTNSATSGGSSVTITGLNFGSYSFTATTAANGIDRCSTTSWSSATTVACLLVAATAILNPAFAKVTVSAVVGTRAGLNLFTFDAPVASYSLPSNGAVSGDSAVTINGLSFGSYGFTPTAKAVVDAVCGTTSWSSATSITCTTSAPMTVMASFTKVTVSAVVGTRASKSFTFDTPAVSGVLPINAPSSAGGSATISGLNFGAYSFTPTALAAGTALCATTAWTSGTTVACVPVIATTAAGFKAKLTVSAIVGTMSSVAFTFDTPVVSYEVLVNAVTSGGATVTISGLNFGVYGLTPTGVAVADAACSTTSWSTTTTIACLASVSTTLSPPVMKATVSAIVGTRAWSQFTFDGT